MGFAFPKYNDADSMQAGTKKILFIDVDDARRASRVSLLNGFGYDVSVYPDLLSAESLGREDSFDLVIVAITEKYEKALEYTDRLARNDPSLPVLLLTDYGVFVPVETLSASIESDNPADLLQRVAGMLSISTHIRTV
jgi:DNA-binding NtrC family response regulator